MDRALIILFALLGNILLGGPRQVYQATGLGRIARIPAKLARDLDLRFQTNPLASEQDTSRRLYAASWIVGGCMILGLILQRVLWASDAGHFVEIFLLATLLPVRPAWDRAAMIRTQLKKGNAQAARGALEGTVWKHHAILDEHGLIRAGIEILMVQFSEKILASLLIYLCFGWPGLLLFRVALLLHETNVSFAFSKVYGAFVHKLVVIWPLALSSMLASAFIIIAGCFLSSAELQKILRQLSEGFIEATPRARLLKTTAVVLKVSLGGPASAYENSAWLGHGTAKPSVSELARALFIYALLHVFLFILLGFFLG